MEDGQRCLVFFSRFGSVRECLSVVWLFLLSSPSFDHEDSDSEHGRFQKILSEKIELASGLSHGAKIRKFPKIRHVVRVWDYNFAWGLALRAMFKMACRDGFVSNGSVLEQYSTGGGQSG